MPRSVGSETMTLEEGRTAAEAFASAENLAAALASREGRERAILDAARTNPLAMRVAAFASK